MANHACVNGILEGTDRYSAAVPLIGLYIAAASTVCSLLMLYDIVQYGFIKRKTWLPCKWFKLNSVTLSLIGVVVKLTVDLTTPMPSALDQLSKLAGTTSLCIYICYIFPSVGDMKDSTNMYALSILVITVFVNMCIQLSTGVIVLFIPEHIIVLCFMLLLPLMLWHYVLTAKVENRFLVEGYKHILVNRLIPGGDSFMKRLKVCHLIGYNLNPKFVACREVECGIAGDSSLVPLVILIQAAVRSVVLKKEKFCTGKSSAYGWSMGTIVVAQVVTVTIGTFASYFRRVKMTRHTNHDILERSLIKEPYLSNPVWKGKFFLVNAANKVYVKIIYISYSLLSIPVLVFNWLKSKMICMSTNSQTDKGGSVSEWIVDEFNNADINDEWLMQQSVSAMEKQIERSKKKTSDLCSLLSTILSPAQSSPAVARDSDVIVNPPQCQGPRPSELIASTECLRTRARLLPLVVLVSIAQVAIKPESLSRNIVLAFRQVFETLYFIEKHIHNTSLEDVKETEVAKALWRAGGFGRLLPASLKGYDQSPSLEHVFRVILYIHEMMPSDDIIGTQTEYIRYLVMCRTYFSLEELIHFMEELFVNLLDPMLAQLPHAIFKAVTQSPDNEFQERVRQSLKHLCKFESWNGVDRWELPIGCENCTNLVIWDSKDQGYDQEYDVNQDTNTLSLKEILNEGNGIFAPMEHCVTISDDDDVTIVEISRDQGDAVTQVPDTSSPKTDMLTIEVASAILVQDLGQIQGGATHVENEGQTQGDSITQDPAPLHVQNEGRDQGHAVTQIPDTAILRNGIPIVEVLAELPLHDERQNQVDVLTQESGPCYPDFQCNDF